MRVAVLLATHNGMAWLPEQVGSILGQQGVEVRLFVSDDQSRDDSLAWLETLAAQDQRVKLLPAAGPFGSAAANFYRLLRDVDWSCVDYIAFSDQDDRWYPDKLARAVALLQRRGVAAVSSNVLAVWPDGRRRLVDKAQPQRTFDYLFEAAGPGCTYVMTPSLARAMQETLAHMTDAATLPAHHDWFCYALCRSLGLGWAIDPLPSMDYRQHGSNEVGVNLGLEAAQGRHRKIAQGWYRQEVMRLLGLALSLRPADGALLALQHRLERGGLSDRLCLALRVGQFRRRWRDRLALAAYFLSGLFWGRRA